MSKEIDPKEIDEILLSQTDGDYVFTGKNGKKYKWDEIDTMPRDEKTRYYAHIWNSGTVQNNGIKLTLTLYDFNINKIGFGLTVENQNDRDVFFIVPGVLEENFKLKNMETLEVQQGHVPMLLSGSNDGIVLKPAEKVNWKVHFNNSEKENDDYVSGVFDIKPGKYQVYCNINVDRDFFCPVSHLKYDDLVEICDKNKYNLWQGNCVSNVVEFVIE